MNNVFIDLIAWSREQHHHLPWRKERTLYSTLVSEIMLQQTTVSTVLKHYGRFLKQFPSVKSLASASEEEVLIAWKGLGYYRRARNLKKAAEVLWDQFGGEFPKTIDELKAIPGIGEYTANALLAIGMQKKALAIDANIERVMARFLGINESKGIAAQRKVKRLFESQKIFSDDLNYQFLNEAVMDLGREICQARKLACERCPLKSQCQAYKSGEPFSYPKVEENKKQSLLSLKLLRVLVTKNEKVLVVKRPRGKWLEGQWELPTFILHSEDKALKQYPYLDKSVDVEKLKKYKTNITKYNIENYILKNFDEKFLRLKENSYRYIALDKMAKENVTTASLKAVKKAEKESKPDSVL